MRLVLAILAACALSGAAWATTSEAVTLKTGPQETGASIGPVWMAKCPDNQRLVGIRRLGGDRIEGLQAICATLRSDTTGVRWLSAPTVPEPPLAPPPRVVTRQIERPSVGTVLRADSAGVSRLRGSRAVVITVTETVQDEQIFPMPEPIVDFSDGGKATDLVCPSKAFVLGLRLGSEGSHVAAIQLICADSEGRAVATVGDWPSEKAVAKAKGKGRKKAKAKTAMSLRIQRIECGGSAANPHDGAAASAVFGTLDNGQVQTIGLSCAKEIDPRRREPALYATARRAITAVPRLFGWSMTYPEPRWFDGAQLAACPPGSLDKECSQASADRYCSAVEGYDHAVAYTVGRFAKISVAATGERCPRGSCRAFASITCGFAKS